MGRSFTPLLLALALLSCGNPVKSPAPSSVEDEQPGSYWASHPIDISDIRAAEDRFAIFAELAVAAPEEEAVAGLDSLFNRLKAEDEVAYYVYSEWMESAFYNPFSPCRNAVLFSHAVDRIASDGVFSPDECEPLLQKKEWISLNREGEKAVIPQADPEGRSTLVLVLDLSCPSCREALDILGEDPSWEGFRHLAICGGGSVPDVPQWEFSCPENFSAIFDIRMTPVFYVIGPDGVVTQGYTPVI